VCFLSLQNIKYVDLYEKNRCVVGPWPETSLAAPAPGAHLPGKAYIPMHACK
jgi:hypothetical protein